jgi:hypothetical protein
VTTTLERLKLAHQKFKGADWFDNLLIRGAGESNDLLFSIEAILAAVGTRIPDETVVVEDGVTYRLSDVLSDAIAEIRKKMGVVIRRG